MDIKSQFLDEALSCNTNDEVQISIVGYEHPRGIPARFCAGLIPAVDLSRQLDNHSIKSTIRIIDPAPIANFCNGWQPNGSRVTEIVSEFLDKHGVRFYIDKAEPVGDEAIKILHAVGHELEVSKDPEISEMVSRIKESGRRHGGEAGANNAIIYMAAHPFSWLDMYHPSIWNRRHHPENRHYVNLMSKPESRFTLVRKFLKEKMPHLGSGLVSSDHYMTVCNTPCYIPLEQEPTVAEFSTLGAEWCHNRYRELKNRSGNHRRALKDFEALLTFLGTNGF